MRITNCGWGVHKREVKGIEALQGLPAPWYAYSNLDLATAPGESREIDIIMVADDRIFLIDLKDWGGRIESQDGGWLHNGRHCGPSPVAKINRNAQIVYLQLKEHLRKFRKGATAPRVHGLVVITGKADLSGIAETEIATVMPLDRFMSVVASVSQRCAVFGRVPPTFVETPLTSPEWKDQLAKFFNVRKGIFQPGRRSYGGFFASSDDAVFEHPRRIFVEYDASDERAAPTLGTLRLWDFTHAEGRFQTPEARAEIAGREQRVSAYLRDASERCDNILLDTRARDQTEGVGYWEVYDRRRRLKRLMDATIGGAVPLPREVKIELARQIVSAVDALHLSEAAHLDIGSHSVWISPPSTVRLSHLMAASYPQVETLGNQRFQFLSSSALPEDLLSGGADAKRKDVFLAAVTVHRLLFGADPSGQDPGDPPAWKPEADSKGEFEELHHWFATCLAWDPDERYPNAGAALAAFNEAVAAKPSAKAVIEGLESFQTTIKSQMQLFRRYPAVEELRDDDRVAMWRSSVEGQEVLVKLWKRASWGDQTREGPRLLDFLVQLRALQTATLPGCAEIVDVFWLGDAMALVQKWIDSSDLARSLAQERDRWSKPEQALAFCAALARLISNLHEQRVAHGDLKPSNILVDANDPERPVLVDLVDFAAADDGEMISTAYAPARGGRFERDCFAVTKIVEEVLATASLDEGRAARVARAIEIIREGEPPNATLLPLVEALTAPESIEESPPKFAVAAREVPAGPLLPDEGRYYLRRSVGRNGVIVRGACEELEIEVDGRRNPVRARRRQVDQQRIAAISKYETVAISALIDIVDTTRTDLRPLLPIIEEALSAESLPQPVDEPDEAVAGSTATELAEDELEEKLAEEPTPDGMVDVATLWEKLIEVESDLKTDGVVSEESFYRKDAKRHFVPFDLESGVFEYKRTDSVSVERLDQRGNWKAIGDLDLQRSKPDLLAIDARYPQRGPQALLEQGERLRFISHFEETSLQRRNAAVTRITAGKSRAADLIKVFDPRTRSSPITLPLKVSKEELQRRYGLNDDQAGALEDLLRIRPLGLLQGPPGTGKTHFISALVHVALTTGIARNVLLASQSHEAVNNAAEAVLKLFERGGETPSIIRVGHEGNVSERLLQYHAGRVERLYKDRFQATLRERLSIVATSLGIPHELASDLTFVETAVRPVLQGLGAATSSDDQATSFARVSSLREALSGQLSALSLDLHDYADVGTDDLLDRIIRDLSSRVERSRRPSPDRIARFRAAASLARDFVTSVSTEKRSFDTFLAGTRQIVAGTCVGLGRSALGLTTTPFDLVIVDEAARCTASELAVPMQAGSWIVLVGDQEQLEPQHDPDVVEAVASELGVPEGEVKRSDFARVFESKFGQAASGSLKTQYRMLEPIGRLVSSSFYGGTLLHGRHEPIVPPEALPEELARPLLWVETDGLGEAAYQRRPEFGKSLCNPVEADCIVALLRRWSDHPPFVEWLGQPQSHAHHIGIICGYAAQRDLIRKKLQLAGLPPVFSKALKIDTIDSYQGKENPIVLLSLVRNNDLGLQQNGVSTIRPGFMVRPNRINVAMSRAMDRLVIVGARNRWRPGQPMSRVADAFAREEDNATATSMSAAELLPSGASSAANRTKENA